MCWHGQTMNIGIPYLALVWNWCKMSNVSCACIFIDRVALAKQVDNALGSVRPSVRLFVCALLFEPSLPVQSICLCVCNQWAYANNRADVVDQL